MIDHTSTRIEEHQAAIGRANRRRYAFQRMLQAELDPDAEAENVAS